MPDTLQTKHSIILFDGVCNLCSATVQFLIKRDQRDLLRFASMQSETGEQLLKKFRLDPKSLNSFILIENEEVFTKSTGALMVAKRLNGLWPLLYTFTIIPAFIRDAVYNIIASNRYRWFGKKNECWLPSPNLKNKFI